MPLFAAISCLVVQKLLAANWLVNFVRVSDCTELDTRSNFGDKARLPGRAMAVSDDRKLIR
jgi:hypothetical protein